MFIGFFSLEGTVRFLHQARNASNVPTDADSAPTYRVYELPSETPVKTGTTSAFDTDDTDGCYLGSFTADAASGFEVGSTYQIRVLETVSSVNHAAVYSFTVVS